ncbi:30S ribosomal protein S1 [Granulicella mallensis]|uniref:30S ribosomal protein S1 n=1 Tax=Granulicella mallensis (strain ATCC BAA-1857 / DSM 23137 / MP5ACTX8) TaxID=682795 RepID=G8NSB2_GRAMM|nr:30S ribosomal protein S1 [Granulicella mallensis]AEU37406.1 RNA binding S1 domain protein [Granulicella mallensis MP5ACTX8]
MPNEITPTSLPPVENTTESSTESFGDLLAQFEHSHSHKTEDGAKQLEGIVVTVDAESVYLDIGFKTEGILPRTAFENNAEGLAAGSKFPVSVKGRNPEGYYELSRIHVAQPKDWSSLEEAFAQKAAVSGVVTAVVKGGLTVDIGMRAFMPASRSGVRDAAEMEKLVGQEITCRIIKLDTEEEDVVVDRRVLVEEQARVLEQSRYAELKEGDIVSGQVRSLASYGAFVDLGGIDGLLHISDISWSRVGTPEDVLTVGQQLQLKVLKVEPESKRISLGLKQLEAEPWEAVGEKYKEGQRITGSVTRLMDFGAFVELEPGIEGLIHVSEMSWVQKVRKPSDLLKSGDTVDAMVLSVSPAERRISLGLKQALGDPWAEVPKKFPVGAAIEGPVTRLMKFGAFVELAEGVEGLVHISEISADKRINHPQDVLRVGEVVKAQVIGLDPEKRQLRLSMKQLIPTGFAEYMEEHKVGDVVSGRVVEQSADSAIVELGDGIRVTCLKSAKAAVEAKSDSGAALDLSSLTSMLNARWKTGAPAAGSQPEPFGVGQVRSFRLVKLDPEAQQIEVELA